MEKDQSQTPLVRGRETWVASADRAPASAVACALLLLAACVGSPYNPSTDEPATIYMEACASCHQGSEAGPSLVGLNLTPAQVEERIRRGGKGMPAFPKIRGAARTNLVAFVVKLSAAPPASAAQP